jgi:gluconate kinase
MWDLCGRFSQRNNHEVKHNYLSSRLEALDEKYKNSLQTLNI